MSNSKKILTGKYCSFDKPDRPMSDIEEKRNVVEDACWSIKDSLFIEELVPYKELQADYLRYQYKEEGLTISEDDILKKHFGTPTDSLVSQHLYAELQLNINNEIISKYGRLGFIESIFGRDSYTSGSVRTPIRRKPLDEMTNDELLERCFSKFDLLNYTPYRNYGNVIKNHMKFKNDGSDLHHTMEVWSNPGTGKNKIFDIIKDKIKKAYKNKSSLPVDISEDLNSEIGFSSGYTIPFMPGEAAAFGGVQQIEVSGYLHSIKHEEYSLDKNGKTKHTPTILHVDIHFIFKDWFGVDEEDVINNETPAIIQRYQLAAFWILQHQRGFPPFINVLQFDDHYMFACNPSPSLF